MDNYAVITETCSCGAQFTIKSTWSEAARNAAQEWRSGHNHDMSRVGMVDLPLVLAGEPVSSLPNCGHGHVWPSKNGGKARCGGPRMCDKCARDLAAKVAWEEKHHVPQEPYPPHPPEPSEPPGRGVRSMTGDGRPFFAEGGVIEGLVKIPVDGPEAEETSRER